MGNLTVNAAVACVSAKIADSKDTKIDAISQEALKMLAKGEAPSTTADFIRRESGNCFSIEAKSARQDDILERMRRAVCAPVPIKNVTMTEVSAVANNLGKSDLSCG